MIYNVTNFLSWDIAELMLNVGMRVKQAREEAGLTQAELGDALDIGSNAISKIETGRSVITLQHLIKLPAILNKPVAWFLDLPPPPGLTAEEQEILEAYRALPPGPVRRFALETITAWAKFQDDWP